MAECGTRSSYTGGCRCNSCRGAWREYMRDYSRKRRAAKTSDAEYRGEGIHHQRLAEVLQEICPDGLTDDCPARSSR